jgi:predicted RNase H-like nuclease (RuvC/YqgF family)
MANELENKDADLLKQISVLNAQIEEQEKTIESLNEGLVAKEEEIISLKKLADAEIQDLQKQIAGLTKNAPPVKKEKTQKEKIKGYVASKEAGFVLYVNEDLEWHSHPTKGFEPKTREEILKLK